MYVKKFEGDSLDEALQAVKSELGPDAIILKTITNKGIKGAFKKKKIEITAAISEQSYGKKSRVDNVLTHDQKENFYTAPASRVNHMINEYDNNREKTTNAVSAPSYGNIGLNKVVNSVSKASNKIKNSLDDFLSIEEEPTHKSRSDFDQFLNEDEATQSASPVNQYQEEEEDHSNSAYAQELIQANQEHNDEMSSELQQQLKSQKYQIELLEQKLFELSEKLTEDKVEHPEAHGINGLRTTLRSLELSEGLVQKILKKATFELTKENLEDADLIYDFALREINGMVNTAMPLFSEADAQEKPVVTALISENSCGQSSMAMKLAVLQEDVKIIRFREHDIDMANSEFTARVFKLDIATVNSLSHLMSEARKAIEEGKSIILDLKLNFKEDNESKKIIEILKRSFEQVEFLITISGIHSEMQNRKILSKYKPYSNGVIISYIDQCLSFGSLLNVHCEQPELPLKFFGTGATVPDDIEAATAERILAGMFQF